jgi:hypothetical protein
LAAANIDFSPPLRYTHLSATKELPMFTQMPVPAEEIQIQQIVPSLIAERLQKWDPNLDSAKIKLLSIQPVTWNNGALGCPIEGMSYTQALVPGYLLWIEYENLLIEVHTDRSMRSIALPGVGFI